MSDVKDTRWTIVGKGTKKGYALCECSCETKTRREVRVRAIKNNTSLSCGCARWAHLVNGPRDEWDATLHRRWCAMISRCTDPSNEKYADYGGRGINVDPRWLASFELYKTEIGLPPDPSRQSLDRIDNDRGYWPDNVRWASAAEQANNKRNVAKLTYNGVARTIAEWASIVGIPTTVIRTRVYKRQWTVDRALTTPVNAALSRHPGSTKMLTLNGVTMTVTAWASKLGICSATVYMRLRKGASDAQALAKP